MRKQFLVILDLEEDHSLDLALKILAVLKESIDVPPAHTISVELIP